MWRWLRIDTQGKAITFLCAIAFAGVLVSLASGGGAWRLYGLLPAQSLRSDRPRVLHDIATVWEAAPPDVLMLGGSQLRELMPEDAFIDAELSTTCGRPIRVFNAATATQPLESSWAMAELLRRPGQLVIVNLNVWRVVDAKKLEHYPRTLLPLPEARSMPAGLEQVPMSEFSRRQNQLGILFTDAVFAVGLYGSRLERTSAFTSYQHAYRDAPKSVQLKLIDARFQAGRLRQISDGGIEQNARAYVALAQHLRTQHAEVAFILAPSSPQVRASLSEFREHSNRASVILREVAPLLDLRETPSLADADFADTLHITTQGRRRLWPQLRSFLRSRLPDCVASSAP